MQYNEAFDLKVIQEYERVMYDGLRHSFPLLRENELKEAIRYSIQNRLYNGNAVASNNYTNRNFNTNILGVLEYIQRLEPIMTSSGVLFKKHKESVNPLSKMIMGFIKQRGIYKKEMFRYPKGSEMFERYNLFQLLEKLNA